MLIEANSAKYVIAIVTKLHIDKPASTPVIEITLRKANRVVILRVYVYDLAPAKRIP